MSQRTQSAQPVNRVFPGRKPDLPRYIREMEADYHQIHRLMQHRIAALETWLEALEEWLDDLELNRIADARRGQPSHPVAPDDPMAMMKPGLAADVALAAELEQRIEALEADKRLRALEEMMRLTQEFGLNE
jgi:hypothetical protein